MARLHIGTSGYSYNHWRNGVVYPPRLPAHAWLPWYTRFFDCVELNATFYRLPPEGAAESWSDAVPPGFRFAVKGSRFLTHMKRLLDREVGVNRFFDAIDGLGAKRGPILWQLPRQMKPDTLRLAAFLDAMPDGQYAFEFRNADWLSDGVLQVLSDHDTALVIHDQLDVDWPWPPPGPFVYWRFHGTHTLGSGRYDPGTLKRAARRLEQLDQDAWVFFNNDLGGHAFYNALELKELVFGTPIAQPEPLPARGAPPPV